MKRRLIRKLTNLLALGLSGLATAIGLFFLGAILWTLLRNGTAGVSARLFTQMTEKSRPRCRLRVDPRMHAVQTIARSPALVNITHTGDDLTWVGR